MVKRNIKIDDDLKEREETTKEEILEAIKDYLKDNPDIEDLDSLNDDGIINEIVDSNTPIYYSNIDALFYLYSDELEEAYKDAGCYSEPPENYKQVCIYFYLEEKARNYIGEKEKEFKELKIEWLDITVFGLDEQMNEDKEAEDFIKWLEKDTDFFNDFKEEVEE